MPKIAIIEDVHVIADMYMMKLQSLGFEVKVAYNGKKGLALVEEMQPDLILLDLMMPELNGAEMLEIIRSKPWGKDIKVFMLSNVNKEEMPEIVSSLNVQQFIIKAAYTPAQIADLIKKELGVS